MTYLKGMSHHLHWEDGGDSFGLVFFGDERGPGAQWAMEAATASHPCEACLADHQMVSVWFRFASIRPYGDLLQLMDDLGSQLELEGWQWAAAIEGCPGTGSNIGGLVDTDSPEYWGKPEADFPREPNAHGFNAASEFNVVVERVGTTPEFTESEILRLRDLARAFARQHVFGRDLPGDEPLVRDEICPDFE